MKYSAVVFPLILMISTLTNSQVKGEEDYFIHENLTKVWETTPELTTCESVCYNPEEDVLYVACINGNPAEKDGNGFIAQVSTSGKIVDREWIKGLNAPKGMGVFHGRLYVTDIDRIVEIDIKHGQIVNGYTVEGAQFLNDISVDDSGNVFVSDARMNKIHLLAGNAVETWLESDMLKGPNGLFAEDGYLLIGISGSVLKVDIETKAIETYVENTTGIDGLEADGNGNYLISDWQGHVNLIAPGKEMTLLLDTTPARINAADIEFIISKDLLLVPTFFDNRVTAYKIKDFR
jgi:hypothetical protein